MGNDYSGNDNFQKSLQELIDEVLNQRKLW
jgi:hypothetical protein